MLPFLYICHTLLTGRSFLQSDAISLAVESEEVLPLGLQCQLYGCLACGGYFAWGEREVILNRIDNMTNYIVGIAIVAIDYRYTFVNGGTALLLAPYAIATQASGDGRHMERHTLEWRIAPWLVVAREDSQVKTDEQVVVWEIEHTIVAVEVGRHEDDMYIADSEVLAVEVGDHDEGDDRSLRCRSPCGL